MTRKVAPFLLMVAAVAITPQIAEAGSGAYAARNARASQPTPIPPVVPGVVVLSAIGAVILRGRRW